MTKPKRARDLADVADRRYYDEHVAAAVARALAQPVGGIPTSAFALEVRDMLVSEREAKAS